MMIDKWDGIGDQFSSIGKHRWSVARLIDLSKDFDVIDAPIDCLYVYSTYKELSLRDMVMHFNAVNDADLSFPIILDEDGEIMDGRHRIMKAIMMGNKTIRMVRFDKNPEPCKINESTS